MLWWHREFYHISEAKVIASRVYIFSSCERVLLKELFFLFVILKACFGPPKASALDKNVYAWFDGFLHFASFYLLLSYWVDSQFFTQRNLGRFPFVRTGRPAHFHLDQSNPKHYVQRRWFFSKTSWKKPISLPKYLDCIWSGRPVLTFGKRP